MMNGKVKAVIYCSFLIIMLIASFIKAQGVPQMPHRFYGYVTIAGETAANGTLIEARIENVTYASTTTIDGKYGWVELFYIPADDPDTPEKEGGKAGDTIDFYVARTYATSYIFEYGGINELNLTITAPTPYAEFTANVTSGTEPLTVKFIDQSMYFDSIESYTWNFGDGNTTVTTSLNITHTYVQNGTYTVALTVNGTAAGEIIVDTVTKENFIVVYDTKPIADFYAEPTIGPTPVTVSFYDNSTSYDGIVAWEWDFGDGNTSSEQNPTHTYTKAGAYTVSLRVTEEDGDNATCIKENYITVGIAPTIGIISPTSDNPAYTQSGKTVQVTVKYTEQNPLNLTIRIFNATYTVLEETISDIPAGTNITQMFNLTISATAPQGKYSLNVTLYNIYNLSSIDTEIDAVTIDNTKPTITDVTQLPGAGNVQSTDDVKVNATITDNLSPIKNVTILYSTDNGTTWNTIPMIRFTGTNVYTATIPRQDYCTHVKYKIEAYDEADNKQVEDNAGQYYTYHVIPEFPITIMLLMLMLTTTLIAAVFRKAAFKNKF